MAGGTLRGKALDDRLGCATLIGLLRGGPYPVALQAAFTVQEEVGLRGARVAGYAVEPRCRHRARLHARASTCPTAAAARTPSTMPALGHGPSRFTWPTARTISDRRLVDHLARTAQAAGLPYQFASRAAAGPMPAPSSRRAPACPSVSVSVPGRYLHGPAALARLDRLAKTRCACWR